MLPNASGQEILWTVMAGPSFAVSVYNVWGAVRDLILHRHDFLAGLGWLGLFKVCLVLVGSLIIIAAGLIAGATPPPVAEANLEAGQWIARLLLGLDGIFLALAVAFGIERRWVVPRAYLRDPDLRDPDAGDPDAE